MSCAASAAKKPVVAQIGTLGASGAYITALGADHIIATKTSLVGSIGVLVQWAEFDQLIDKLGVSFQEIKTSPLKASPNGFEPASEEAKAGAARSCAGQLCLVHWPRAERREMNEAELKRVSDGRVFTGSQSLPLKLIDELGDQQSALNWLINKKNIASTLPLEVYKPEERNLPLLAENGILGCKFVRPCAGLAFRSYEATNRLDGLVSVWQPSGVASSR